MEKKQHPTAAETIERLPLVTDSQANAKADALPSIQSMKLKTYDPAADNVRRFLDLMVERMTRPVAVSLTACVHCGLCAEACPYALTHPGDSTMTPVYKADRMRRIFKQRLDWTGRVFPWWVRAGSPADDADLNRLKNIVFGTCSLCRRCTFHCPMGVDTALLIRFTRGLLTELGIVPDGVFQVSRNEWETGNRLGVTSLDYLETLQWMRDDLRSDPKLAGLEIPMDVPDGDFMYTIDPREIAFDPRSIARAAKIFHLAGERWTLPSRGWDQTNFGLHSGDDRLGGFLARALYEEAVRLRAGRIVISESGPGFRSTRWEGCDWAEYDQDLPSESIVRTIKRYLEDGRIRVNKAKNALPITFHDSCHVARSGGMTEEPRFVLNRVCADFREMTPNRTENYCCSGGGGLLSMDEYRPLRLEAAALKARQLEATGAKLVCTMCYDCLDGLNDVIKHYHLDMKAVQMLELVDNALVY